MSPWISEEADFVLYNTCTVRENANSKGIRPSGPAGGQKEKVPRHDDRPVRLHDAGGGGGGEDQKELPLRGSDLRHPQHIQAGRAGKRQCLEAREADTGRAEAGPSRQTTGWWWMCGRIRIMIVEDLAGGAQVFLSNQESTSCLAAIISAATV